MPVLHVEVLADRRDVFGVLSSGLCGKVPLETVSVLPTLNRLAPVGQPFVQLLVPAQCS